MSEQDHLRPQQGQANWFSGMLFVQLFKGFRTAMQPGKLLIALAGLCVLFLAGGFLDALWPRWAKVPVDIQANRFQPANSLEAYIAAPDEPHSLFTAQAHQSNTRFLKGVLKNAPFGLDESEAVELIEDGKAVKRLRRAYDEKAEAAGDVLNRLYKHRKEEIDDYFETQLDTAPRSNRGKLQAERDKTLRTLEVAYENLSHALLTGQPSIQSEWTDLLILGRGIGEKKATLTENTRDTLEVVTTATQLARSYAFAKDADGLGVFEACYQYNAEQFHNLIQGLIFERSPEMVRSAVAGMIRSKCWIVRHHPLYALLITIVALAVMGVAGGAICRMTALQYARSERLSPFQALGFSVRRLGEFFTAPIVPVAIILVIAVVMWLISLLGAIPVIGEILAGLLLGLALIGGFVIALILIGTAAGVSLMYPTIATEGSDSFDAISRAFSYIFSKPWKAGFYAGVAAIYGAICYLFVRLFAFLMLASVYAIMSGAINLDGSSLSGALGKLETVWPAPTFSSLHPDVHWLGLNGSEAAAAGLVALWANLIVGTVMAFVMSYYFSQSTIIYFLLRHQVDATDMEDVYVEQDINDLITETPQQGPVDGSETVGSSQQPSAGQDQQDSEPPAGETSGRDDSSDEHPEKADSAGSSNDASNDQPPKDAGEANDSGDTEDAGDADTGDTKDTEDAEDAEDADQANDAEDANKADDAEDDTGSKPKRRRRTTRKRTKKTTGKSQDDDTDDSESDSDAEDTSADETEDDQES